MLLAWLFLYFVILLLLLIHELGHAVAAKWHGLQVDKLVLGFGPLLFQAGRLELRLVPLSGGCHIPDYPRADPAVRRNIALMGPLYSILAGGLLYLVAPGMNTYQVMGLTFSADLVRMLAAASGVLGAFNLLPLPPMDGWQVATAGKQVPQPVAQAAAALGVAFIAASYGYPLLSLSVGAPGP